MAKDRILKGRKLREKVKEDERKAALGWPYVKRVWQVDIIFNVPDGRRPKWHGFVSTFGQTEAARKAWIIALYAFNDPSLQRCKFTAEVVNVSGRV